MVHERPPFFRALVSGPEGSEGVACKVDIDRGAGDGNNEATSSEFPSEEGNHT